MRETEFEDEFHRLLGRLVHATARFDFNVGLQLNSFGIYYQRDVKELLDPCKTQLKLRLKELRKIVLKAYTSAGEIALAEFDEWFARADKAWVPGQTRAAMRRLPAVQPKIALKGSLPIR